MLPYTAAVADTIIAATSAAAVDAAVGGAAAIAVVGVGVHTNVGATAAPRGAAVACAVVSACSRHPDHDTQPGPPSPAHLLLNRG